jgi:hypothetical protein
MRLEPKGSFVHVRPERVMSGSNSRSLEQRGALAWASVLSPDPSLVAPRGFVAHPDGALR